MDATTVAVDLAKDVFQVATANRVGRILERKRLTRGQFERFVDALPAGTDGAAQLAAGHAARTRNPDRSWRPYGVEEGAVGARGR